MHKYIIFGTGAYMSDMFDLIHANDGCVYKIYQNVLEKPNARVMALSQRLAALSDNPHVYESLDPFVPEEGCRYVVGTPTVQKYKLIETMKHDFGISFSPLIHPSAVLGSHVHIGEGVIIGSHVAVGPHVYLDDFCCVNRSASIGHDTSIGKFSRIAPSVAIAGNTKVGDKCSVGIHATILEKLVIGPWAVIGAGSVVTKDIPEGMVAYGVPAKVIRENETKDFSKYLAKRNFLKIS